ncbi:hypothetical protein AVT69_gp129 [Pseudomonas phage PhiPA3]|uniref:Uncharacterized protein 130 n=1 Tax=Pseudomonas phage PhiPA3 TaxID=998086 RepID=F8SK04_BPPA3|nr:hypothetical protein AVT69_gp129 [Pseudomonas phage PhiPA3]AEH03554.1 hypothetical protein [Pseudomonas phage PhiPA3]
MAAIDSLMSGIKNYILFNARERRPTAIRIYSTSQNLIAIRNLIASVSFELSNGFPWPIDQISEAEVNERREGLIHELYLRYNVLVEVFQKPWPMPDGDYAWCDCVGFNRIFWDLDVDDLVRLALGDV